MYVGSNGMGTATKQTMKCHSSLVSYQPRERNVFTFMWQSGWGVSCETLYRAGIFHGRGM